MVQAKPGLTFYFRSVVSSSLLGVSGLQAKVQVSTVAVKKKHLPAIAYIVLTIDEDFVVKGEVDRIFL